MKRLVLYPFLFVLYIILIPLAGNLDQVDPSMAIRPLALLLLAAGAGLLLLYALFRDWQYAGYLVFLILAFFFMFGHLYRLVQEEISLQDKDMEALVFLGVWGALLAILSISRVWARLGGRTWLPAFLNLVFAVALLQPGVFVLTGLLREPPKAHASSEDLLPNTGEIQLDCSSRPDIYFIVLDAYGRADVLDGLYGLDNRPFLETLERKGFYVAGQSHTDYIQTVFSIPSALNFSYLDPPAESVNGQEYFSGLVKDNSLMRSLKRCGYRTVAIETGFYFTDHPEVDVYLSREDEVNEFEDLLLAGSPVEILAEELNAQPLEHSYEDHRQRVLYSFRKLAELSRMRGPKVVFAHILSPHPPFVFDPQGRPVEPERDYSIGDGDDFRGTPEEYREGYARQVQFVNRKLEQAINAILARSSRPPVIIIQGDHGPGSGLVWDSPSATCLWERTAILNAYYLPGGGEGQLYPSISPVNSFRVVLNTYFDAGLPLLPDRTYFTSHRLEGEDIDITAERTSRQNCGLPNSGP